LKSFGFVIQACATFSMQSQSTKTRAPHVIFHMDISVFDVSLQWFPFKTCFPQTNTCLILVSDWKAVLYIKKGTKWILQFGVYVVSKYFIYNFAYFTGLNVHSLLI